MASSPQQPSQRRSRGISFRSDRSKRSSGSANKSSLRESHDEKNERNLHTKADPLLAMSEAQPMAVALEKSNLGSLRDFVYKDQYGNPITDPDLANPTRPRLERPLETIRSFEAAIYGKQSVRPASFARTDEEYSRRGSYFGGLNGSNGHGARGYDQAYYGRGSQSRPDSYVDAYSSNPPADSYYPYNQGRPRPPRHNPRANPDQAMYPPPQNGYGYQKSYENVAAAGSARNSGAWADPASSVDELQQLQLQQQQVRMEERAAAEYGFQGFGPNPNLDNGMAAPPSAAYEGSYPAAASGRHPYEKPLPDPGADAAPPATSRRIQRKAANTADNSEKRKSWFKRRFSKD